MYTTLRQWGNSVGVRIPKEAMNNCKFNLNDELEIITSNESLTLKKMAKKTFCDIAKPLVSTKDWTFSREEANERR